MRDSLLGELVDESIVNGLVLSFGLGSIVTNPEPTELEGPKSRSLASTMRCTKSVGLPSGDLAKRRSPARAGRRERLAISAHYPRHFRTSAAMLVIHLDGLAVPRWGELCRC